MSCDYSLHRDRGQVVPQWHKTASKFHRIRCTKCLTSPDNHQKKESPHLKVVCLPVTRHMDMFHCQSLSCSDRKKNVSGCSAWLLSVKKAIHEDLKGQPEQQEITKWLINRKADCCPLLKRITRLKCVNSEFKSVNTHPEKGCLQWLHGTMSEPPWKSH